MKRLLYFVLLALTPALANAFGLGNLDLNSALNEPFDARIQLLSPTADELDSLKISLADSDAFARAKIDRPFILSKLRFDLRRSDNDGPDYIRVYSQEPIREPFLNFLIEVSWSNGRLFREYTVLLDPPLYDPNARSAQFAKAVEPTTTQSTTQPATKPSTPVTVDEPEEAVTYSEVQESKEDTAPASPTSAPNVSHSGGDYGPTTSSDTLWSIASEARPNSSISVNKMMMALLRANPDAFIDGNINGLKRGQILRMPNESEINALSNVEALKEAQSQYSAWADIRENLSSNVSERPEVSSTTQVEAVETEAEAEGTVDAELKLVSADDSGEASDQVSSVDSGTGEELILAQETIQVLTQENIELKDRVQESEALLADLKRLLSLKDDELAALQEQMVAAQNEEVVASAEEEIMAEGEEIIAEAEETATDVEEAILAEVEGEAATDIEEEILAEDEAAETEEETVVEADAEEEIEVIETEPAPASTGVMGMVEQYLGPVKDILLGNPLIGIAVAAVIVLLLIVVVVMKFRKPKTEAEDETVKVEPSAEVAFPDFDSGDMGSTGESAAASESATVLPDSEDETVTPPTDDAAVDMDLDEEEKAQSVAEETPVVEEAEEEEEDPLQEVNTYLAFEQFDQAEEFVRNVINDSPDNPEYHTKLLEVFYTSGDKKSYEEEAKVLHELVGGEGEYWNMATAMWSEMSPNRALFEAGEDDDDDDTADNTSGGFVDVTADEEAGDDTGGLDFDIGGAEDTSTAETPAAEEMLDITGASSEEVLDMTTAEEVEDLLDVTAAVNIDEEIDSEADTIQVSDSDDILDISGAGAENLLDNTSAEESPGDDLLDVTAAANLDLDSEEDLLDVTAATSAGVDSSDLLDLDIGDGELNVENAADSEVNEDSNEIEFDITAGDSATDDSESSSAEELPIESSEESNVLDFDMSAAGDSDSNELELDIAAVDSEAETSEIELDIAESSDEEPALDIGLDEPEEEAIRLDVEESNDDMSLDMDLSIAEPEAGADGIELDIAESSDEEPALEIDSTDSAVEEELSLDIDMNDSISEDELSLDMDLGDSASEEVALDIEDDGVELDLSITEDEPEAEAAPTTEDNAGDNLGIDLDFSLDDNDSAEESSLDLDGTVELPKNALSLDEDDDDDEEDHTVFVPRAAQPEEQSAEDEIATKLDLAKAYVELGDKDSAKTILDEVMADGNDEQRKQAEDLLGQV